jgi:hypothetical protein
VTEQEDVRQAATAILELAHQLRRHYYHSAGEQASLDLIHAGAVLNLEWDERDALWVQLDATITLEVPANGTTIGVYAEQGPVVTLWFLPISSGETIRADWDLDLPLSERERFLRKVAGAAADTARQVNGIVGAILDAPSQAEAEDRRDTVDVVRDWLSGR